MTRIGCGFIAILLLSAVGPTAAQESGAPDGPLAALDVLAGRSWAAQGDGYATTLTYRWLQPGHVLEATNVVTRPGGEVLARYSGSYAWDGGRQAIVFFTASGGGEIHRGRAWWADDVFWHEAEVSGGTLTGYASAIRPGEGGFEYFADYGSATATPELLATDPIHYTELTDQGLAGERFIVLLNLRHDLWARYEATGEWPADPEANEALRGHVAYWQEQFERGKVILTGGMGGDFWDKVAQIILNVRDRAEAEAIVEGDPAIRAYVFKAQIRPFTVHRVAEPQ